MPRKSLLTFHEPDGRVRVEILGWGDDFADLVDPHDGSVSHGGPFAMHGDEWRIESVTLTEELMHIKCVSTAAKLHRHAPTRSRR